MTAIELAECLEKDPSEWPEKCRTAWKAAAMLRAQHEAIGVLRDGLGGVMHLNNGESEFVIAFKALAAAEEI